MTITINLYEIFRFIFVALWLLTGGFVGFMSMVQGCDKEGAIMSTIFIVLCLGSALMLFVAGR